MATGARRTFGVGRPPRPRPGRPRRRGRAYRLPRAPRYPRWGSTPRPHLRTPMVTLRRRLRRPTFRSRKRGRGGSPLGAALLASVTSTGGVAPVGPALSRPHGARGENFPSPIPKVRYRPGLARAWRLLRLQFCLAWGLPWARQRRLTNFIAQLRGVSGLGFIQMCLCGLGALVRESGLGAPSCALRQGAWVNGRLARNPFFQLYKGDRVALGPTESPFPRRDLAWIAPLATAPSPAWEVDGLTRAVTVVYEPTPASRRPLLSRPLPFLTFRMYNWKYRH